jgi:hypothetical protein
VLPWLPDDGDMPLLVGPGELMLPGAALVEPGIPTPGVAAGIPEPIEPEPEPDGIGRGIIVIGEVEPPDDPAPVPMEPWSIEWPLFIIEPPILPPVFIAVALQAYFPLPLPYCAEPFM